ncbi:MAG: hypothetical protein CL910_20600 [Deltaproteobacteria bacterium]|jgi:catechol 2,3-dioxygenase-like lactoylglutathione lyase family enzyme|nr:hypothetical protein [Deltaproteobacteria bacterium]
MRLRQVALVARDLERSTDTLCSVLGLEVGFQDPGVGFFGLVNGVIPVGDTFLEVVSPAREGTTAGRLLERRGGDGGYMVILQSQNPEADRARVDTLGVRVVWESPPELEKARAFHMHPRDIGGAITSLDAMYPPESWEWGGPDWQAHVRTERTAEIVGVELQAADPAGMGARWAEVLDQPLREEEPGVQRIDLDEGGFVRFHADRDGRGEGVSGLVVRAADAEAIRKEAQRLGHVDEDGEIRLVGIRIELA